MPVLLGLVLARAAGHAPDAFLFVPTLVGVLCFHAAANLLNDAADFRRGLDRTVHPGSGAVVRGWLTPGVAVRAAVLFLAVGTACGLYLAWRTGWPVLALGAAGGLLTLFYTRTGPCLKVAGWGDPAIFLAFSVLPLLGSWWVQARQWAWTPLVWSLPTGSLAVAILHANNWRDRSGDRAAGCRTAAGRLGEAGSALYYRILLAVPYGVTAAVLAGSGVSADGFRQASWIGLVFLSFPLAWRLGGTAATRLARLDADTAGLHLSYGLLLALGLWLGG